MRYFQRLSHSFNTIIAWHTFMALSAATAQADKNKIQLFTLMQPQYSTGDMDELVQCFELVAWVCLYEIGIPHYPFHWVFRIKFARQNSSDKRN